ncbi:MAG: hypothetical protein WKF75_03135 [Singulisphaera sp.]
MQDDEKSRLYRQVAQQANEFVVLERAPSASGRRAKPPPDPPEEAAERARIEAELAELRSKQATIKDPEKALADERNAAGKRARRARRGQGPAPRRAKAPREAWDGHRSGTIVHSGPGVSAGLQDTRGDVEALTRADCRVHTAADWPTRSASS